MSAGFACASYAVPDASVRQGCFASRRQMALLSIDQRGMPSDTTRSRKTGQKPVGDIMLRDRLSSERFERRAGDLEGQTPPHSQLSTGHPGQADASSQSDPPDRPFAVAGVSRWSCPTTKTGGFGGQSAAAVASRRPSRASSSGGVGRRARCRPRLHSRANRHVGWSAPDGSVPTNRRGRWVRSAGTAAQLWPMSDAGGPPAAERLCGWKCSVNYNFGNGRWALSSVPVIARRTGMQQSGQQWTVPVGGRHHTCRSCSIGQAMSLWICGTSRTSSTA